MNPGPTFAVSLACIARPASPLLPGRHNVFWRGPIRYLLIFCRIRDLFGRRVEWRGQYHGVAADKTLA